MHVHDTGESGMVSRETTPGLDIAADVLHSTECYRHRSRTYPPSSSSQIMASPNAPSQQHSRRRHSAAFPALLPHPIPNPNPTLSPSAGTRRPRTPSLDGLYNATQPPSKRSRANNDDQRAREPRPSYSESVRLQSISLINH